MSIETQTSPTSPAPPPFPAGGPEANDEKIDRDESRPHRRPATPCTPEC